MSQTVSHQGLLLPGLDGTNPLGFLAALGVLGLATSSSRPNQVLMSWEQHNCLWTPILIGTTRDSLEFVRLLAKELNCPFKPNPDTNRQREELETEYDRKKTELKRAYESLKKRNLRGNERKEAEEKIITPIRNEYEKIRLKWLEVLRSCVPSVELSLGKHLDASIAEFREHIQQAAKGSSIHNRAIADLYAALGSDASEVKNSNRMQATSFCFITGSGHQCFLQTVSRLYESVTPERLHDALFSRAELNDEKLSMRWDPREDRRYALMWRDPGTEENKPKTNWALNILGYRGLTFFPSIPQPDGLKTTGWRYNEVSTWTWPIWLVPLSLPVVRSLLAQPFILHSIPDRATLASMGVAALYESVRINVGEGRNKKTNFTPARRIA